MAFRNKKLGESRLINQDPDKTGEKVTSAIQITVTQRMPTASAGDDRVLAFIDDLRVVLDGSLSDDPDGDPLRYEWTQIGGPGVTLVGASGQPVREYLAIAPADYAFVLRVVDDVVDPTGALTSDPDTVRVRVSDRGGLVTE